MQKFLIGLALALGLVSLAQAQIYGPGGGGLSINAQTLTQWQLDRYNTAGIFVDSPIVASRATGVVSMVDGVQPGAVAVASLPACAAGNTGQILVVNNAASSPVYNATATGGGAVVIPVMCNGANWTNH